MNFNPKSLFIVSCMALMINVLGASADFASSDPSGQVNPQTPVIGPPSGADVGRIVRLTSASAVSDFQGNRPEIRRLLASGIQSLTRSSNNFSAWSAIANPQEKIGIFIAPNGWNHPSTLTPIIEEIVSGLTSAGVPASNIFLWSRSHLDTAFLKSSLADIFPTSQFTDAVSAGYDASVTYDSPVKGTLIWSDVEFGDESPFAGRLSHVTTLLTRELDRVIQINSLAADRNAGVRGHIYSLAYASVDNFNRFLSHPGVLAEAAPEIFSLEALADKTCLFITDALIGSVVGNKPGKIHYHPAVSELWLSRDPVALDSYALQRANTIRESINIRPLPPSASDLLSNSQLMQLGSTTFSIHSP